MLRGRFIAITLSVGYLELVEQCLVAVLRCQACVGEVAGDGRPVRQSTVVVELHIVGYDKWHNTAS